MPIKTKRPGFKKRKLSKLKFDRNWENSAKNEKKTKFGAAILDQESSPAKQDQLVASIFDEIKKQAESVQSPVIFNHELIEGSSLLNVKLLKIWLIKKLSL